jgi:hypothetical protein
VVDSAPADPTLPLASERDRRMLRVGLLRDLAGSSYPEIAALCGLSPQAAAEARARHARRLLSDEGYRRCAGELGRRALVELHRLQN